MRFFCRTLEVSGKTAFILHEIRKRSNRYDPDNLIVIDSLADQWKSF